MYMQNFNKNNKALIYIIIYIYIFNYANMFTIFLNMFKRVVYTCLIEFDI
jgi:hypothetical protein